MASISTNILAYPSFNFEKVDLLYCRVLPQILPIVLNILDVRNSQSNIGNYIQTAGEQISDTLRGDC